MSSFLCSNGENGIYIIPHLFPIKKYIEETPSELAARYFFMEFNLLWLTKKTKQNYEICNHFLKLVQNGGGTSCPQPLGRNETHEAFLSRMMTASALKLIQTTA